ncbi:MAG TPA: hypothetical protein VFU89_02100 [Rhabdochlamydiaceae bacterium]|nr:hypothetical protein [Rhabdochlamydiaceae bacterium]
MSFELPPIRILNYPVLKGRVSAGGRIKLSSWAFSVRPLTIWAMVITAMRVNPARNKDAFMITGAIIIVGSNLYILNRTRKEQAAKKAAEPENRQNLNFEILKSHSRCEFLEEILKIWERIYPIIKKTNIRSLYQGNCMINNSRRETGSASREDRAGFAGWSYFYLANPADIVDPTHPVFLYRIHHVKRFIMQFPCSLYSFFIMG